MAINKYYSVYKQSAFLFIDRSCRTYSGGLSHLLIILLAVKFNTMKLSTEKINKKIDAKSKYQPP